MLFKTCDSINYIKYNFNLVSKLILEQENEWFRYWVFTPDGKFNTVVVSSASKYCIATMLGIGICNN